MILHRQNSDAVLFGVLPIYAAVRCRLNNDAVSLSQDQRVTGTDDSQPIGAGGSGSQDSGISLNAGLFSNAQAVRDDAILISGSGNKFADDYSGADVQIGGLKVGGANSGSINVTNNNNADGVEAVVKTFADTVKELAANRPADGAPINDDEKKEATPDDEKSQLVKWLMGVVAFVAVAEILRRLFLSKPKS